VSEIILPSASAVAFEAVPVKLLVIPLGNYEDWLRYKTI
jgi:hypothetical protein